MTILLKTLLIKSLPSVLIWSSSDGARIMISPVVWDIFQFNKSLGVLGVFPNIPEFHYWNSIRIQIKIQETQLSSAPLYPIETIPMGSIWGSRGIFLT